MNYPLLESAILGKKLHKSEHYRIIGGGIAGLLSVSYTHLTLPTSYAV